MYDRDAQFMYWLHAECGYTFTGESSLYRLTVPEMRMLYAGFRVHQRQMSDAQAGVDSEDRSRLAAFDERVKSGEFDRSLGGGAAS